jgi:hypothetical protein
MIKVIFYGKSLMPILRRDRQHATWGERLRDAVEKPGQMLAAYTAFHNYSFGNALLALEQCVRRIVTVWKRGKRAQR